MVYAVRSCRRIGDRVLDYCDFLAAYYPNNAARSIVCYSPGTPCPPPRVSCKKKFHAVPFGIFPRSSVTFRNPRGPGIYAVPP